MKKTTILLSFLLSFSVYSQDSNSASKDLVKALVNELIDLPGTPPGISIAISGGNEILFAEGFGYANLRTKRPVTQKTQFRAASVSKVITITALAKLIEKNKLSLEDSLQKFVPTYAQNKSGFTVKQLTGHIAGIPHYTHEDHIEKRHYNSVNEALAVFSHIALRSTPGDKYEYSTHAYTLLSRAMEVASRQNYLDYLDEILSALSMTSTGPDMRNDISLAMTELYDFHSKEPNTNLPTKVTRPEDPSYKWAGGGLISTPSDLVKMANAYMYGFIEKDLVTILFSSQKLNSGEETGVGIGWRRNWDMQDRKVFEHAGAMEGARSVVSIFPKEKLAISIMANAQRLWAVEETAHILALPFLIQPSPVVQPKGIANLNIIINNNGNETLKNGTLLLDGENDRIITDPNTEEEKVYKIIYLQRENMYALVHPHGLLYTEIDLDGEVISGKTWYYRSPNLNKPSDAVPLFEFKGDLKSE